uniref:Mitochondrial protein n=1 Tax=Nicotiana tabacum TaxID=4097 RepID=A0A1S4BN97_TOBAC|nr:PREDICTED: uncharacterized protein LOC107810113 [Nicotiana tabacum]
MCDKGNEIKFNSKSFTVTKLDTDEIVLKGTSKEPEHQSEDGSGDPKEVESDKEEQEEERTTLTATQTDEAVELKNIKEALKDLDWIIAMQEELNQFERSKVWHLVQRPKNRTVIGTRWVFRNKLDEQGARLDWIVCKFQANYKESHLKAVKSILRYLKGTPDLCLWYPRGYNFDLVGYANADYAGFHVDRKSTSGTTHFLGSCLVSWGTKKQNSVALSTAEAEYVTATS